MVISVCQHNSRKKHGKDRNGNQRYRCLLCQKTFIEQAPRPLGDMRISMKDAAFALNLLLEGMSIRAASRLTGLKANTICDLILVVGENCQRFLSRTVHGVEAKDIQCDEIWSFVRMKERQRKAGNFTGEEGDSWTFFAIDRNTKLILAHHVGQRDSHTCDMFLRKLYNATAGRCQISTDGLASYTLGVPFTFKGDVDFGQLVKSYRNTSTVGRYSPAKIIRAEKKAVYGRPDPERVCTSHIERANLTVRMQVRRFTRLTNAHSKSLRHHKAMQALFVAWYNFARKHETIKQTPAMAAGLAQKPWTIRQLIERAAEA
jgi:transposase-like protein/IS1 family transposase